MTDTNPELRHEKLEDIEKDFYRSNYNFAKRDLEKKFDMFNLNQTQKQSIRESIDRMIEEQRKEYNAPEKESL